MPNLPTPIFRIAAMAILVGGLAYSGASFADPSDTPDQTPPAMDQTSPTPPQPAKGEKMRRDEQDMARHVEERIKTLHDKLGITAAEEPKWADVAQTMRDNEATIRQLIQQRHENPAAMTAVDDLQSYANITQAHTDGIKKLIPAFQSLYNDMSDEQKKKADKVFGSFEGHHDGAHAKKHG